MDRDICIIGQGLTGLTAAHRLAKAGKSVTIVDLSDQSGGLAADIPCGGTTVERMYHHCFASDEHVLQLAAELGLAAQLKWYRPSNGLLSGGKLYPFTTPADLLTFSPLPVWDRVRTGMTVLTAKRRREWRTLENTTAKSFLIAHAGRTAYEKLWKPLLVSKFGDDADQVSAVWIWNKFKLRGGSREGLKEEVLGYLDGGFGRLGRTLAERLPADVLLRNNETALNIRRINNGYAVETDSGIITASAVIAAVSAPVFNQLTDALDLGDYRSRLNAVRYKANLCLLLSFDAPVTPFYWTTVCDRLPFVAAVEQTRLVPAETYGRHLLYLSRYLDESEPLWSETDDRLASVMKEALFAVFPEAKAHCRGVEALTRSRYAQPVIPLQYSRRMPEISTPLPGLFLAGMSQIYPEDRGLNYAIRLGNETAGLILA